MVQLIEERGRYKVFRKWGRVGAKTPQVPSPLPDHRYAMNVRY